jgi:uncharacterized protein YceK
VVITLFFGGFKMKNSAKFRRITAIRAVIMVMFGLVLAGCASVKTISEETETSRAIHEAASALVLSKQGGITAGALVAGLADKFPGLKLMPMGMSFQKDLIQVSYGGTVKWPTNYAIRCTMVAVESTEVTETQVQPGISITGGGEKFNQNTIVTSITSVVENRVIEE